MPFDDTVATRPAFAFDNTWVRDLPEFGVRWQPATAPAPRLLWLNRALARELGLDPAALDGEAGAALFAGNALPAGAEPFAQVYAGHQFGGFSPQLGDGRALLVGELIDTRGQRRDLAFKGSGRTPFSRGGDGLAAVGPMLREVIIGEAMHALGIPTTRALAVAATGGRVVREAGVLPGAVLTRVAASHLRVGSFQFFAARGDRARLARLLDYAIARHDPALATLPAAERPFALLDAVARRQARLVAQWLNVGFIHGVMNTDNTTISGETIDYGPCAFLEAYDPATVFSSIDHGGRYAYGNQAGILRWNLARLAEALLPLALPRAPDDEEPPPALVEAAVARATETIDAFPGWADAALREGQRAKLGLAGAEPGDVALADDFLALLQAQAVDFTLAWRALADAAEGREAPLRDRFVDREALSPWLARWRERLARDGRPATAQAATVRAASPWIIPRNHRVEQALAAAQDDDDLAPLERLLAALADPFTENPALAWAAEPGPEDLTRNYRTFCGT